MNTNHTLIEFISSLTPEQIDKLISNLPKLIGELEELTPSYPPERS